jgi:hypothetical protein
MLRSCSLLHWELPSSLLSERTSANDIFSGGFAVDRINIEHAVDVALALACAVVAIRRHDDSVG